MIEVTCPVCKGTFQCEKPQIDIIIKCRHCSANIKLRGSASSAPGSAVTPPEEVVRKVALYEKTSNILWVAIGIYQIFIGIRFGNYLTMALGAYNACMTVNGFKSIKNICVGNYNIIKWYDDRLIWIIIFAVINLVIGGVIGVFLSLFNLYVRDYVLKHRYAFEAQQ